MIFGTGFFLAVLGAFVASILGKDMGRSTKISWGLVIFAGLLLMLASTSMLIARVMP